MNKGIDNPGFRALPQSVQSKIISNMKYGGRMYGGGGNLNQLTEFTEGGTHEQNPIGGIPQGTGPNGQLNLVEQGETKLNDQNYIFSDQLKVDGNTIAQFNLPKSFMGKTFAEASKKLNKPHSRRENDTIEMADTQRNLSKLKEAQEFHKQQEVQKKLDEINALDPNALPSLMGQQQAPMEQQGGQMSPEEMAMMEQQAMGQQGMEQQMDPSMMEGMMRNGGHLMPDGGYTDEPRFSWQTNTAAIQPPTAEQRQFMFPSSARFAPMYSSYSEAQAALFRGENDATRTYYQDNNTIGEIIGNEDINNRNFQDWGPNKSKAVVRNNLFSDDGANTQDMFVTNPNLNKREAQELKRNYFQTANLKNFGGWLNDNKQGVMGGLQTAAGIGAMFIPGGQGIGANLIGGGIGNITNEIQGDQQAEMQKKAMEEANRLQQPITPFSNSFGRGGNMYNDGGDLEKLRQQAEQAGQWDYDPGAPTLIGDTKQGNYFDTGNLSDTTMDLSVNQGPLDFGLQLAPIAWNLAKGLQKPMEFKGEDFYSQIDPAYVDYTNAENIAKETGAGVKKGIKNTVPGGGSYASSMLASQQNLNKALSEIGTLEENTNKKIKGETDKLNLSRKDAANMQALQLNLQAKQAKDLLLQEALLQGKAMSEQGTANDLAQKYATMSAPDISRFKKVGYNPYYQQVLGNIKNKKK